VKIHVTSRLSYQLTKPTDFLFLLHAAKSPDQTVTNEQFQISSGPPVSTFELPGGFNCAVRTTLGAGGSTAEYRAEIDFNPRQYAPQAVREFSFPNLPPEVLVYLLPSRFCPADLFTELAKEQFSGHPKGYLRALAIADWVHDSMVYVAGSSGPHTTAADAYQKRQGVCRDFAHVAISVCRAAGIPARYASVYAHGLEPPDFHAIMQVFLEGPDGGAWFTLDPTHMSSADAVVRIAAGRDAADVAFAWTQDNADSTSPEVTVTAPNRVGTIRNDQAVVGA
jgi:transglutaminase-like putative cysteine protease